MKLFQKITALFLLIVILTATANGSSGSQSVECQASVRPNSAAFTIENLEGIDDWIWNRANTEEGVVEYWWSVAPGEIDDNGTFKGMDKFFGFVLGKRNDLPQATGSLNELFRYGEYGAWTNTCCEKKTTHTRIDGAIVKAGVHKQSILIGITDPKTFEMFFKDQPKTAYISAFLPAIEKHYSCVINIDYQDSPKPKG